MNNAQLIFNHSVSLMEQGIIGTTGRYIIVEDEEGNKRKLKEPEPIHTFITWKNQFGRVVKKGEKAKAKFLIWLPKKKKKEEEEESEQVEMFQKNAYFFTLDQTEPIEE